MTVAKVESGKLVGVQKPATPRGEAMRIDPATHRVYAASAEYKPGAAAADGKPGRPTSDLRVAFKVHGVPTREVGSRRSSGAPAVNGRRPRLASSTLVLLRCGNHSALRPPPLAARATARCAATAPPSRNLRRRPRTGGGAKPGPRGRAASARHREAQVRIAGQLAKPEVSFEVTQDSPHKNLSFGYPFEIGGQRGKRIAVAKEELALADLDVRTGADASPQPAAGVLRPAGAPTSGFGWPARWWTCVERRARPHRRDSRKARRPGSKCSRRTLRSPARRPTPTSRGRRGRRRWPT